MGKSVQQELTLAITALSEISKAEGAYSMDRMTYAENCIQSMQKIAIDALRELGIEPERKDIDSR